MENKSSYLNVEDIAKKFNFEIDSPVVILPQGFETAETIDNLAYNTIDIGAIKLLQAKDIEPLFKLNGDRFYDCGETFSDFNVVTFFVNNPQCIPVIIQILIIFHNEFRRNRDVNVKARFVGRKGDEFFIKELKGPGKIEDVPDEFWDDFE